MLYRKKPMIVEAEIWDGDEAKIMQWAEVTSPNNFTMLIYTYDSIFGGKLYIETLEGLMHVSLGDYVICGIDGEFWPCKPNIFKKSYERVENEAS